MENEQKIQGKEVFDLIMSKVRLLRIEMDLLEKEGNAIREIGDQIVRKLRQVPIFNDASLVSDAANAVHQKWVEQAQRYYTQANVIAKIMVEKSKQILDLVQILKTKLRDLGFVIPDENEFIDWDDIIFEKEE